VKKLVTVLMIALLLVISGNVEAQTAINNESQKQIVMTSLSSMPLAFTENNGQFDDEVLFQAKTNGATFYFSSNEVLYLFARDTDELIENLAYEPVGLNQPQYKKENMLIKAQFINANPNPEVIGIDQLGHRNNYFCGNDPSKWQKGVANYSAILYQNIYPGIDLKYYGDGKSMKYDFIVNPGADLSQIKICYNGIDDINITPDGDLELQTAFGLIHEKAPYIYQKIGSKIKAISGRYCLIEGGCFGFVLNGKFNPSYRLVIDPTIVYCTYFGGPTAGAFPSEGIMSITHDDLGCAIVSGRTGSDSIPLHNPIFPLRGGHNDAFIAKLSPDGSELIFSTYIGGINSDEGKRVDCDSEGNIYLTGFTTSPDFPIINGYEDTLVEGTAAFLVKISPEGDSVICSTFLGGLTGGIVEGWDIFVDNSDLVHLTGGAQGNLAVTVDAYDPTFNGGEFDLFWAIFDANCQAPLYCTYFGGAGYERHSHIFVDDMNNTYIYAYTTSDDLPVNSASYDSTLSGEGDVYVVKFASDRNTILYSTYLGGSGYEECSSSNGIVVDRDYNIIVGGNYTASTDFPIVNPISGGDTLKGDNDGFIVKLHPDSSDLIISSYISGSSNYDNLQAVAVDTSGNIYLSGLTMSSDLPWHNPYCDLHGWNGFLFKLTPNGSIIYCTPWGCCQGWTGTIVDVDENFNIYLAGGTSCDGLPVTDSVFQTTYGGDEDGYVAKFSPGGTIYGIVTDQLSNPIEDVYVSIDAIESVESTDISGNYAHRWIPIGTYNIHLSHPNYTDTVLYDIELVMDDYMELNVILRNACYQYMAGDVNMSNGIWPPMALGADVTYLVNYFKASPTSVPCLLHNPVAGTPYFWTSADANGDCIVMGSDVVRLVAYFRGQQPIEWCADYPPCWHPIDPSFDPPPVIAPDDWPNCETPTVMGRVLPTGDSK